MDKAKLELKNEELETKVEELDDEYQMFEIVLKYNVAMEKFLDQIDLLENKLLAKNQEINWKDYLATKELPALPKQ
ncbi:6250_t:CDS:2 [Funneliformis geosporum]|uniref:6250_t:CDS:1 n=1 Tax=Funneliformis geosporum TaxID=1117311 RepID=A0A9W4SEK3_9GLOM|nr:6250_t:CDS:2 [Funneliformis geosporum]